MGVGNFLPSFTSYSKNNPAYKMVYVDTNPEYPKDIDDKGYYTLPDGERSNYWDECSDASDDFREYLMSCLPESFHKPQKREWIDSDQLILAENELYYILLADNETRKAVIVAEKDDAPGFAAYWLPRVAYQIFDQIAECYPVSVRTGPWTSSPYLPTNQREAA